MYKFFQIPYRNNGRDFNGCDCYGLVKLLAKEKQGITLPDFNYENAQSNDNEKFFNQEKNNHHWKRCEPKEGAIIVIRIEGIAKHIGYMLDATSFMHITQQGVSVGNIEHHLFKSRIVGFWSYHD